MPSSTPERIAFLGGFLPRLCGIATFTSDICEAVASAAPGSEVYSCAVNALRYSSLLGGTSWKSPLDLAEEKGLPDVADLIRRFGGETARTR